MIKIEKIKYSYKITTGKMFTILNSTTFYELLNDRLCKETNYLNNSLNYDGHFGSILLFECLEGDISNVEKIIKKTLSEV